MDFIAFETEKTPRFESLRGTYVIHAVNKTPEGKARGTLALIDENGLHSEATFTGKQDDEMVIYAEKAENAGKRLAVRITAADTKAGYTIQYGMVS
jgi:hypothetical protein